MAVMMKCAACGAEVEFESNSLTAEATCPGCEVRVRRRVGDEQMAMPVSMTLPDQFQPLDLGRLGKQSAVLVERYKKENVMVPEGNGAQVDATLARALESLAHSIEHLEERLTKQERRAESEPPEQVNGGANGYPGGAAPSEVYPVDYSEEVVYEEEPPEQSMVVESDSVVHLHPEDLKAQPLGAPVLVRREAARVAHHYRRENQKHWDHRGREQVRVGLFQQLMGVAPKTTVTLTILLALGLVAGTIIWMDFGGLFVGGAEREVLEVEATSMGKLWADDPEAGQAEMVARGFLSATSAKVAKPFVYESERIERKFDELFVPIERPEDYRLALQSRATAANGASVFAYRVSMADEKARMLVVLPEGKMPKVFWEFFAEVGDYSWEEFMKLRSSEPAKMRVWAFKGSVYPTPYNDKDWQCYILHDYTESHVVYGYAKRGEGADWRLSNGLETKPVKFGRRQEVMAQVVMNFMSEVPTNEGDPLIVVEIKEVPVVSWLPEQFAPRVEKD